MELYYVNLTYLNLQGFGDIYVQFFCRTTLCIVWTLGDGGTISLIWGPSLFKSNWDNGHILTQKIRYPLNQSNNLASLWIHHSPVKMSNCDLGPRSQFRPIKFTWINWFVSLVFKCVLRSFWMIQIRCWSIWSFSRFFNLFSLPSSRS